MSSGSTAPLAAGKSARACDSCLRRRARWYCAADDAFLCQACDTSVHSANPLARRHERVRLRPTSSSHESSAAQDEAAVVAAAASTSKQRKRRQVAPAWSRRKARTRRPHVKSVGQLLSQKLAAVVVVPEVAASESSEERKADGEEEEQLLYHRVPSFDRALAEFCTPPPLAAADEKASNIKDDVPVVFATSSSSSPAQQLPDHHSLVAAGFGPPTDAELREFAADMEALLGDDNNELDESFYMESLGLMMTPQPEDDAGRVKKDGAISGSFGHAEMKSEPSSAEVQDNDLDCCSPAAVDDHSFEHKATTSTQFLRRSLDLKLNYEAVIESWGTSPWTDGQRPHIRLDNFWPHHAYHSGAWTTAGGEGRSGGREPSLTPRWGMDGCREARVSRYREKRRTRLFAKKIRYEVRKLNAEKRPRMKGRFVKRPATGGGAAAIAAIT